MALFNILVFPGFIFLSVYSLIIEFIDRKLYAKFQNRVGPHWYQPLADILKLLGKESVIPDEADKRMFNFIPIFALAAASTAFLYVPIWSTKSLLPFSGDVIVVMYLLTIPTLTFFLAGWYSNSVFATIGAVRVLTQLFAYEVPLLMAILAPALLAGTWSFSGIAAFYCKNPSYSLFNIIGFVVAIIAIQGKLERTPFDIPEAETEIVAGPFVEYSGKRLAIFRMAIDVEMVVVSSIIAAVYIPFFMNSNPFIGFIIYIAKTLFVVLLLAAVRSVFARLRLEQMVDFCWIYLAPLAILQILIDIVAKGVFIQ